MAQYCQLAGLVSGDCEAIRTELADQQMKMHVRNVHSIRANNPTRFAGLLLMAKDMQVIMGAIVGMTTSVSWEQLRSSSVNATVFDRLTRRPADDAGLLQTRPSLWQGDS
ncbi:hypothetical protein V8C86DRAFT_3031984 [Haematococcus lacustris]